MPLHGPFGILVEDDMGFVLAMKWAVAVYPHDGPNRKSQMLIDVLAQLSGEALETTRRLRFEPRCSRGHNGDSRNVGREDHVVRSHRSPHLVPEKGQAVETTVGAEVAVGCVDRIQKVAAVSVELVAEASVWDGESGEA